MNTRFLKGCLVFFLLLFVSLFLCPTTSYCVNYGFDTSVSILNNPTMTGANNIMTFGYPRNGITFQDSSVTCTFKSVFPLDAPLDLKNGILYLDNKLVMGPTANFASSGTIFGGGNIYETSGIAHDIYNPLSSLSTVLNLVSRVTPSKEISSLHWSYDGNYLTDATLTGAGATTEVNVYSFNGSSLILAGSNRITKNANSVRWHPLANYFVVGHANGLRLYQFTAPSTLTSLGDFGPAVSVTGVAWQQRGRYVVAVSSTAPQISVYEFSTSAPYLTLKQTYTYGTARTFSNNTVCWAPAGNTDKFIVGANANASNELDMFYYNSADNTVTLTVSAEIGQTVNSLDWSPTGTYVSIGLNGGSNRLAVYQDKIYNGTLTKATEESESINVTSVNWKRDGTALAVGLATTASESQFRTYSFNTSLPALTNIGSLFATTNIKAVSYAPSGTYIAAANAAAVLYLSVYKPVASAFIFQDTNLFINADITLKSPVTFKGNCSINGRGNNLIFEGDGSMGALGGTALAVKNATLKFKKPNVISLTDPSTKITFEDLNLDLGNDVLFGDGSLKLKGDVVFTGTHVFNYSSAYTMTVDEYSNVVFENGAGLSLGRLGSSQPLYFSSQVSSLNFNDGKLYVINNGLELTKGTININGLSHFDVLSTDTEKGIVVGDCTLENDPVIKIAAGAELNVQNGAFTINSYSHSPIEFGDTVSALSLDTTSSFYLQRPLALFDGCFQPSASEDPSNDLGYYAKRGSYLNLSNTRVVIPESNEDFTLTGTMNSMNKIILDDADSIKLNSGCITQQVTAMNGGSTISGLGNFSGELILQDRLTTVTWGLDMGIEGFDAILNGGRIFLDRTTNLLDGFTLLTTGSIILGWNEFEFGASETIWTSTLYFDGNGGSLKLNAPITLTSAWTFSGDVIFDLNGESLTLGPKASLLVERGSSLCIKNAQIKNLVDMNIRCLDNAGRISFSNSKLDLHNDYEWSKGLIIFKSDTEICTELAPGNYYDFNYTSNQTSEIEEHAVVSIQPGVNLKIGRANGSPSTPQPLVFHDPSSTLNLNGGSLTVTSSGMTLTKGKIEVTGISNLYIESKPFDWAFVIGDGTLANDGYLRVMEGGKLTIQTGKIFYNNFAENGLDLAADSSVLSIIPAGGLTALRSMTISDGRLRFTGDEATFMAATNADIYMDGVFHKHDLPYSIHRIKYHYKNGTYYFNDGDYCMFDEGVTLAGTIIFSRGTTTMGGGGVLSHDVTVQDKWSTLKSSFASVLDGSISLNGGTLYLDNDLKFASDKTITGSGSLNLNKYKLIFGGSDLNFTDTLYINSNSGIDLNSDTRLSGEWAIDGDLYLNCHNNVLDLANGGILRIRPNSNLHLTDTVIKGFTNDSIIFMDDTSKLWFNNDFLELDESISTTIGGVRVEGPTTLGLKNHDWTFDSNGSLTVDGVSLWQDPMGIINHGKIKFGTGVQAKYLSLVSTATIKTLSNLDVLNTSTTNLSTQIRTNSNYMMANTRVYQNTYTIAADETIQNFVYFQDGLTINDNKTLTIASPIPVDELTFGNGSGVAPVLAMNEDMYLKSVAFNNDQMAARILGNNRTLFMEGDWNIATGKTLNISSPLVIDGQGHELQLTGVGKLFVDSSVSVTLQNMTLKLGSQNGIDCYYNGDLTLNNVLIDLGDSGYTFTSGRLHIQNDVMINGYNKTMGFVPNTASYMTIYPNSMLNFDLNTTFTYDGGSVSPRNKLRMSNVTSWLDFNGSTLRTGLNGLSLTNGTLILDNKVTMNNGTNVDQAKAITLGDGLAATNDMNVEVLAGAQVEVLGYLHWSPAA